MVLDELCMAEMNIHSSIVEAVFMWGWLFEIRVASVLGVLIYQGSMGCHWANSSYN